MQHSRQNLPEFTPERLTSQERPTQCIRPYCIDKFGTLLPPIYNYKMYIKHLADSVMKSKHVGENKNKAHSPQKPVTVWHL